MKTTFGFSSGATPRVMIALGWTLAAAGAALVLNAQSSAPNPAALSSSQPAARTGLPQGSVDLNLEAGFRVAEWRVQVGTTLLEPDSSSPTSLSIRIPRPEMNSRFEIFIEARPEDFFADHRHTMLITLRDQERRAEKTIWANGDVSSLLDVDALLSTSNR